MQQARRGSVNALAEAPTSASAQHARTRSGVSVASNADEDDDSVGPASARDTYLASAESISSCVEGLVNHAHATPSIEWVKMVAGCIVCWAAVRHKGHHAKNLSKLLIGAKTTSEQLVDAITTLWPQLCKQVPLLTSTLACNTASHHS